MKSLVLELLPPLDPFLNLYLPEKVPEPAWHKGYSDLAWQRKNRIRPLSNVAGRITTAECYGLGGSFDLIDSEPQASKMRKPHLKEIRQ